MFSCPSHGHQNAKNDSFFVFTAEDGKKLGTFWAKYLSSSERSYLSLLNNAMNYCVLRYH